MEEEEEGGLVRRAPSDPAALEEEEEEVDEEDDDEEDCEVSCCPEVDGGKENTYSNMAFDLSICQSFVIT